MRKGQSPIPFATFVSNLQGVSEVSWARLAAYLDGEGSINISFVKPTGRMKSPAHHLLINIGNSDPRLIVWLKQTFGGWAGPQKQAHKEGRVISKKPRFLWVVNGLQAAHLLEQCLPYFIMKKGQAEIGIAFQALKSRGMKYGPGGGTPPAVLQQRDKFRDELMAMHAEIIEAPESLRTPEKE